MSPTLTKPPLLGIPERARGQLYEDMIKQPVLDPYDLPEVAGPDSEDTGLVPIPFSLGEAVDEQGNPLPPKVAAKRLAARLDSGRSAPRKGKRDPVGALVTVNLELEGLRGDRLLLFWRLSPVADGKRPLPRSWTKPTVAYRLTPGTERDSANLDMWVPLPKRRGPYTLDLILTLEANGARLAGYETAAFDCADRKSQGGGNAGSGRCSAESASG